MLKILPVRRLAEVMKERGLSVGGLARFMGVSERQAKRLVRDPEEYLRELRLTHPAWAVWLSRYFGLRREDYPRAGELVGLPVHGVVEMDPRPGYVSPDVPEGVLLAVGDAWYVMEPASRPYEAGFYFLAPTVPPFFLRKEDLRPRLVKPFSRVLGRLEEAPVFLD